LDLKKVRAAEPVRVIRGRNVSKADVGFYRLDGMGVVAKDYRRRPFLIRQTVGRFFTRREAAAYRAAAGIPGIPEFLGRVGPCALTMRWIEGTPLSALAGSHIEPAFFDRAASILEALHDRGIALGDLHHRDMLVAPDGSPWLVDFAMAWVAGQNAGWLRRSVFRRFQELDRVALARMRARFTGEDETATVLATAGPSAAAMHSRGRRIKRLWDRLRGRSSPR